MLAVCKHSWGRASTSVVEGSFVMVLEDVVNSVKYRCKFS